MLESIKNDQGLRPYFFDFIGKSMSMMLSETFTLTNMADRAKLHKDYYSSLQILSEKLNEQIPTDQVDKAIQEVLIYYMKDGRDFRHFPFEMNN
jgi:hypothetical protein